MRRFAFSLAVIFCSVFVKGQCPVFTASSIHAISESTKLSGPEKMIRLLDCLQKMKAANCTSDSTYTTLLRKIGFLYADDGDYVKAISCFRLSVQTIETNLQKASIARADLIKNYYWLSTFYDSLNNTHERMRAVDSCLSASQRWGSLDDIYGVLSLESRAEYDFDIGDYQRCVEDAELCQKLAWAYAAKDAVNANRGKEIALISLGWMTEAFVNLKDFKKAEAFLSANINDYKTERSRNYAGFLYSQLAEIEIQKGDYAKALAFFRQSLRIEKKGGYDFTCKQILNTIGYDIFFKGYNQPNEALRYYTEALRYRNKDDQKARDDAMETIEIFGRMAEVYAQQNHYRTAFAYFQRAFDLLRLGSNENNLLHLPIERLTGFKKTHVLTALVLSKADVYLQKFKNNKDNWDVQEAIRLYGISERMLLLLRATQTNLQSKLFWRSNSHRLYENAIEAAYLSGDVTTAFSFFEKSRAVLLNEQVSKQRLLSNADIESEAQLQKKINLEETALTGPDSSSKNYKALQQSLFADRQTMDGLVQRIREKNPLYYQSVLDTSSVSLEDVRNKILNDHQAVVHLFSGDSAVYLLLITAGKTVLNKINKLAFDRLSQQYIAYLANASLLNKDTKGYKAIAHQLYSLLFGNGPVPKGRIIVSPDGRNFPFESLVVSNGLTPVYFLNDHAVSYTYSLRYLFNNFSTRNSSDPRDFLGIAPVTFGGALTALPGSDASLVRLASYFDHSDNLTLAQASRSRFLRNFSNYNIIQLYSHASGGEAIDPVLYFADSALYLSDLLPAKKPITRLIVLSACETGQGQLYLGEGVFNFNRSFAACGIPSSVTNLWSVDDRATYRLTELFYKYLSQGLPIDLSLQQAKKEFIQTASQREQLPYYWAAAILVGKTDAVVQPRQGFSRTYFLLCIVLCLSAAAVVCSVTMRLRLVFL